ncbi:hypothetical protein [Pseudomonas sp. 9Ag]|jgi:hypothetical protein|uniref:hypothetical protein n=1 Tax=Pseudomonas sp. 9Ag TaxID=2653167 RepID=UPI00135B44E8|nr:hypothetical protein [Pseudomonas sp. 9Ag]|tara:strand:- start:5079 stop:5531 length:453 start_codon:yes stop_codon:yes gene_type:complete
MKPHLRIVRHPYEEPDHLNLVVSASNGNLSARFEYYENARAMHEWASVLEQFPRHSSDIFLHEIGSETPEDRTAYYFRLRVFNTNSAGGCAIQLRFNNNQSLPDREIFDFCIRAEPSQINRLGKLLRTFAELRHEVLEWNVTEGELHEFS